MKGLGKVMACVFAVCFFMLLYVHEQISLIRVSYLLDVKSDKLAKMTEEYRQVKFEVDQLKAPRLLEQKIKQLSLDLTLPQEIRVIKMPASRLEVPLGDIQVHSFSNGVLDFLGRWVEVAQAKTDR